MPSQCGAFCSFCGRCGRAVTKELKVEKPLDVAPPGVVRSAGDVAERRALALGGARIPIEAPDGECR